MLRNIIEETANPPGPGTSFLLNGATTGRLPWLHAQTFSTGAAVYYAMEGLVSGTVKVEWGVGKVTAGPPTLFERTTVIGNSDGNTARLNFTGAVRVYNDTPAERDVYEDFTRGAISAQPHLIGAALWAEATGGPNDWTLTTKKPGIIKRGSMVAWFCGSSPTGPVNIDIDGFGLSPLFTNELAKRVTLGDMRANQVVQMTFDGSSWRMMNPAQRSLLPIGAYVLMSHGSLSSYSSFVPADGRNLSRTAYASLHAFYQAQGYPYGSGDGSTTFSVPDLRGRVIVGRDNLGGSAAGRIGAVAWSSPTGVNTANQIGAAGGDQYFQLHGHGVSDPGHGHSVTVYAAGSHQHTMTGFVRNSGSGGSIGGSGPYSESAGLTDVGGSHSHAADAISTGTGVSIQTNGSGNSQNIPPSMLGDIFIFAGDAP